MFTLGHNKIRCSCENLIVYELWYSTYLVSVSTIFCFYINVLRVNIQVQVVQVVVRQLIPTQSIYWHFF